jgi:acyl carrier protein
LENGKVQERILHFILKRFPRAKKRNLDASFPLLESGIIDSLGMLDVVSMLEEDFGIAVQDEELVRDNFQTVSHIANFVSRKSMRGG